MLWTALTLGVIGSTHCAGMCGPIALAIPHQKGGRWNMLQGIILYNLGRSLTYVGLGILFGLLGSAISLTGMQAWLSIGIGGAMVILALLAIQIENEILKWKWLTGLVFYLKMQLGKRLQRHGKSTVFSIGLINGLLPCGLVYMALLGAIAMANWQLGAAYMLLFGLGTIPMMMTIGVMGSQISIKLRRSLSRAAPFVIAAIGILLIFRGLNFNLPTDFRFWQGMQEVPMCH